MATKRTVVIGGKAVDMEKLEDLAALQAQLLPPSWPAAKRDGVRLFVSLQTMLALEFQRHLAHNFKNIVKIALEQKEDGEGARVGVSFAFEIDLSAPTVAAIAKQKMSYSHKFSTEGKAKSVDINQDELELDEGGGLDPGALERDNAAVEEEERKQKEADAAQATSNAKPKKPKKAGKKQKNAE